MMYRRNLKINVEHACTLPPQDDIVARYIDSGLFVNARRSIRRFLTVSDINPRSRNYLRSSAAIQHEKSRHLRYYYHMIHPFSDFRTVWETAMVIILFSLLVLIPIETSMDRFFWYIAGPKLFFDILCCVDICITFATGYYEQNTKKIVLNPRRVAKRYLWSYFLIDLLSSIPVGFAVSHEASIEVWFIKLLTFLKLLRITTFVKYLDGWRDRQQYSIYKFKAFKLIVIFLIALLWATSIIYIRAYKSADSWLPPHAKGWRGLLICCFNVVYSMLLVGYGVRPTKNVTDMIFSIICLIIGYILKIFIYAQVLQLVNKNLSASNKYEHMVSQLTEYIRYKQLPDILRKRILTYFDFRFEKNYYKESEIFGSLSDNLREDITLHTCQRLVESVDFFKDLPPSLLDRIVKSMKSEIFLANDVIVRAGIPGDSMYFINAGTIAVYTSGGKEICHLADGAHFGEIALMMDNEKRVASVVAVECCELFNLSRKDFRRAIAPYPELNLRMRNLAYKRLQKTITVMSADTVSSS